MSESAALAGERMHMHRNTAPYRMGKLEKHFDLDLSSPEVREKMLAVYEVFSLMQHHALLRAEGT